MSPRNFQQILEEIHFLADCTRSDIYSLSNELAIAAARPAQHHWPVVERLLRYLCATSTHDILFRSTAHPEAVRTYVISARQASIRHPHSKNTLSSFSDADYVANISNRRYISSFIHLFNSVTISWAFQKQGIQNRSTCETEYVTATAAGQQTI